MSRTIRRTSGPGTMYAILREIASATLRNSFSIDSASPVIGDGTTAGKLRTTVATTGKIAGVPVTKASTDDLWDLTGPTDLTAGQYQAHWLYIDAAGTASIGSGAVATSAAAALAALPAPDEAKCILGCYVAGSAGVTDYDAALAAQGTIYNGIPAGASLDGTAKNVYLAPARIDIRNA